MTSPASTTRSPGTARSLLHRLVAMPDLPEQIQALNEASFSALVRKIGVEDAAELVALATTAQVVRAFDEDLFTNTEAGERETFDAARFVVWLEVLLEAGEEVAAARFAELDEDFVAHALSSILVVLDEEALRQRLDEGDEDEARDVDKALESALTEDLDGYILVAKQHDGWDAALTLVLALDRDHRALLVRLLDRIAAASRSAWGDLDELSTLLTEAESLAEDAESAREDRRSAEGYVEPRAARGFLTLARSGKAPSTERDASTRAYFRELRAVPLGPASLPAHAASADAPLRALPEAVRSELEEAGVLATSSTPAREAATGRLRAFTDALQALGAEDPACLSERMEELAYLTNVLLAGHAEGGDRLLPKGAADAALATVCLGAALALRGGQREPRAKGKRRHASVVALADLLAIVRERTADDLFRVASSALAAGLAAHLPAATRRAFLLSSAELDATLG